jgi:hypothetical protein
VKPRLPNPLAGPGSVNPQLPDEEVVDQDVAFEAALDKLHWGRDISIHLYFFPSCHSKEGRDEKYNDSFLNSSFCWKY